jgi:hypothetical protein
LIPFSPSHTWRKARWDVVHQRNVGGRKGDVTFSAEGDRSPFDI